MRWMRQADTAQSHGVRSRFDIAGTKQVPRLKILILPALLLDINGSHGAHAEDTGDHVPAPAGAPLQ